MWRPPTFVATKAHSENERSRYLQGSSRLMRYRDQNGQDWADNRLPDDVAGRSEASGAVLAEIDAK
jgi:hypothetical protein